jgi:acyl-CoA synthetase (NDP forming)
MVRGGVELRLGTRWDATFGAVVVVGAGGVYVELLDDVGVALAPIDVARARSLLAGLRIAPLLDGARGRPRLDIDAAADACARLSALAAALGPRLAELDVNPLLVQARGVVALDARATLGPRNA